MTETRRAVAGRNGLSNLNFELCSLIGLLWLSDFIYEEQNSVHHLEDTQVQDSCRQAKRLKE